MYVFFIFIIKSIIKSDVFTFQVHGSESQYDIQNNNLRKRLETRRH